MGSKNWRLFLLLVFFILINLINTPCLANATTTLPRDSNGTILDIPAYTFEFNEFTATTDRKIDNHYIEIYNNAVQYYNNNHYDQAIPLLKELAFEYHDNGKALYLLGNCYHYNGDYQDALIYFQYANDTGYDPEKINQRMFEAIFMFASRYSKQADYLTAIALYKAALRYQDDTACKHNVGFCYTQLAEQLSKPDNIVLLLYAYNFVINQNVIDDTLAVVANNLCSYLLTPPQYQLFDQTIPCIKTALSQKDDPYLHQSLGLIYLFQNKNSLAKVEFKAVVEHYQNTQYINLCKDLYQDIGQASYHYRAKYPIYVSGSSALTAQVTVQIPQNDLYQVASNLQVQFNNQLVPYQILTDQYGSKFISLKIAKGFKIGGNALTVDCDVEVENKRINSAELAGITLSNYQNNLKYQQFTESTKIFAVNLPQIQKIAQTIKQTVNSDRVIDLVTAVYNYVINQLEYKDINNREKVSTLRALTYSRTAVCEDYAALTVTLLRALKIPATYFSGDEYQKPVGHAWAIWYTPDYHPIPLDTTWGDTSKMPEFYFLYQSNLNITNCFNYDSNIMPASTGINIQTSSRDDFTVSIGADVKTITKTNY